MVYGNLFLALIGIFFTTFKFFRGVTSPVFRIAFPYQG